VRITPARAARDRQQTLGTDRQTTPKERDVNRTIQTGGGFAILAGLLR
jgi:hypothetical protein